MPSAVAVWKRLWYDICRKHSLKKLAAVFVRIAAGKIKKHSTIQLEVL